MSSRRKPKRAQVVDQDRVCAHYQTEDQHVRWISSHSFYIKQMTWCVEEVTSYWRSTMRQYRGRYPYMVPDHIRFCMSWLSGLDCTGWSVRQICIWLNHRLGRGHKFETLMYMAWIHQSDPCPLAGCYCAASLVKVERPRCSRPCASAASQVHFMCGDSCSRYQYACTFGN